MSPIGTAFGIVALAVIIHTLYRYSLDLVAAMAVPQRSTKEVLTRAILWFFATIVYVTLAGVIIGALSSHG